MKKVVRQEVFPAKAILTQDIEYMKDDVLIVVMKGKEIIVDIDRSIALIDEDYVTIESYEYKISLVH